MSEGPRNAYDPAEGRMGGTRGDHFQYDSQDISHSLAPERYNSAEGEAFLDEINWTGLQNTFWKAALRIDPERALDQHIAVRKNVYFHRLSWEIAKAVPPTRMILFDFEKAQHRARILKVPEDLYALKVFFHEQVHVATGQQDPEDPKNNIRSGLGQHGPMGIKLLHWVVEGMNEWEARHQMADYVAEHGFKQYSSEDVGLFLSQVQNDETGHEMAMAFLEGIVALFAHEFTVPADDREKVWNGFRRAHYRNTDLLCDEYKKVFSAVLGEDKMKEIAHIQSPRQLLKIITDEDSILGRLRSIDSLLADKLKGMADTPYRDENGNEIIEL